MIPRRTREILDSVYARFHSPRFLGMDPLVCVRPYAGTPHAEVVGLVAASLAYGRVEQIIRSGRAVIGTMQGDPCGYVRSIAPAEMRRDFRRFRHRFTSGDDVASLLGGVGLVLREAGSLDACFRECCRESGPGMREAATRFVEALELGVKETRLSRGSGFLLPSPAKGSACKRLNMYFRWMIRPDDGIDLGAWKSAPPSMLIVPLDAHTWAASRRLKLTRRRTADWRTAEEITARLREADPLDPVRFDFSLCRAGMLRSRGHNL